MTDRTTTQDITRQSAALEESLKALGMMRPTDRLAVRVGSKTYGIAFRLILHTDEGFSGSLPFGLQDFLGMTKREAHDSLYRMNRTVWAVRDHLRRTNRRHADDLDHLIDGDETDGLGAILAPVRDHLRGLSA